MKLSAFYAGTRARRLIKEYGLESQQHGPAMWVRFPGERKGVWRHGWIALLAYLEAECPKHERAQPKPKRKSRGRGRKPGRKPQLLVGTTALVEVPQDSGEWHEAVIVQREPKFRSRVLSGDFVGYVSTAKPKLIAKEASHESEHADVRAQAVDA